MDHLAKVKCNVFSRLLSTVDHTDRAKVAVEYVIDRSGYTHVICCLSHREITFHCPCSDKSIIHIKLCQIEFHAVRCAADTDIPRIHISAAVFTPANTVHGSLHHCILRKLRNRNAGHFLDTVKLHADILIRIQINRTRCQRNDSLIRHSCDICIYIRIYILGCSSGRLRFFYSEL